TLASKVNSIVTTLTFLHKANFEMHGRNGWDNKNSPYLNYINYGTGFTAFWDGSGMLYMDNKTQIGDDGTLADMTERSVICHELGHSENPYQYQGASGAWEEFKADMKAVIAHHLHRGITTPA